LVTKGIKMTRAMMTLPAAAKGGFTAARHNSRQPG